MFRRCQLNTVIFDRNLISVRVQFQIIQLQYPQNILSPKAIISLVRPKSRRDEITIVLMVVLAFETPKGCDFYIYITIHFLFVVLEL